MVVCSFMMQWVAGFFALNTILIIFNDTLNIYFTNRYIYIGCIVFEEKINGLLKFDQ